MTMGGEGADPHVPPPLEVQGMAALPKPSAVHILLCGLRTCCPSALHAALLVGEMRQEAPLGTCSSWHWSCLPSLVCIQHTAAGAQGGDAVRCHEKTCVQGVVGFGGWGMCGRDREWAVPSQIAAGGTWGTLGAGAAPWAASSCRCWTLRRHYRPINVGSSDPQIVSKSLGDQQSGSSVM